MEYRKGILFIRLKGELTKLTYKCLINYLIPIIKEQGIKYIVFNLAKVSIIDNFGKDAIKMIINTARHNYGRGLICNSKIKFENYRTIDNELLAFNLVKI